MISASLLVVLCAADASVGIYGRGQVARPLSPPTFFSAVHDLVDSSLIALPGQGFVFGNTSADSFEVFSLIPFRWFPRFEYSAGAAPNACRHRNFNRVDRYYIFE